MASDTDSPVTPVSINRATKNCSDTDMVCTEHCTLGLSTLGERARLVSSAPSISVF